MNQVIPKGRTKEDIKIREQLIKDFYARWISEHCPDGTVVKIYTGALDGNAALAAYNAAVAAL